jgi:hypothetical protein
MVTVVTVGEDMMGFGWIWHFQWFDGFGMTIRWGMMGDPPWNFPIGNGGPGPHYSLEIWGLWGFHLRPLAFFRGILILVAIWPHLVEAGGSIL